MSVKAMEHIFEDDNRCWLWEMGNCALPWSWPDREGYQSRAGVSKPGLPKTLKRRTETAEDTLGRIGIGGSLREIVIESAACGCAVVQMDLDAGLTPCHGRNFGLDTWTCVSCVDYRSSSREIRGVVRALNQGGVDCNSAGHNDSESLDFCVEQAG